jgi:hypothetical protein
MYYANTKCIMFVRFYSSFHCLNTLTGTGNESFNMCDLKIIQYFSSVKDTVLVFNLKV